MYTAQHMPRRRCRIHWRMGYQGCSFWWYGFRKCSADQKCFVNIQQRIKDGISSNQLITSLKNHFTIACIKCAAKVGTILVNEFCNQNSCFQYVDSYYSKKADVHILVLTTDNVSLHCLQLTFLPAVDYYCWNKTVLLMKISPLWSSSFYPHEINNAFEERLILLFSEHTF